jgi:hypothetical protein
MRAFVTATTCRWIACARVDEFTPLDGRFRPNVLVQVKNGALDFQPREPFHPLLGAMPRTPLMLELQVTKEYLGQDTHLAYLGPSFEEVLDADTRVAGPGSTVAKVIDGSLHRYALTASPVSERRHRPQLDRSHRQPAGPSGGWRDLTLGSAAIAVSGSGDAVERAAVVGRAPDDDGVA